MIYSSHQPNLAKALSAGQEELQNQGMTTTTYSLREGNR
jgi:hypothetical protein